jgi:membrane protease YdiL (CAAX protease family)
VWLVLIPLVVLFAAEALIPSLPYPAERDLGAFLGSEAGEAMFSGAWGWFGLLLVSMIFNTVLGEELLFRGFLLPRMNGAFGRADWLVNGVLFAAYHLHLPWGMPAILLDAAILSYPTKRYQSAWIGIAVHSTQTVLVAVMALALVL